MIFSLSENIIFVLFTVYLIEKSLYLIGMHIHVRKADIPDVENELIVMEIGISVWPPLYMRQECKINEKLPFFKQFRPLFHLFLHNKSKD